MMCERFLISPEEVEDLLGHSPTLSLDSDGPVDSVPNGSQD